MTANPYESPSNESHQVRAQSLSLRRILATVLAVVVLAIAKWWLPAFLGTGESYTLGMWIEEWILCVLIGVFGWFWVTLPIIYFGVAYGLHYPVCGRHKFELLVIAIGLVSSAMIFLGGFCTMSLMKTIEYVRDRV